MPTIELNWVAMLVAIAVCFCLSYVWFGVIFAKRWSKEMGLEDAPEHQGGELARGLIITLVGIILMVFVLSNNLAMWQPSTWGLDTPNLPVIEQALSAAFFICLGFIVPEALSKVAWEKRSWTLFAINVGYYFCAFFIAALILLLL